MDEATAKAEKLQAAVKAAGDAPEDKGAAALKALAKAAGGGADDKADDGNPFKGMGDMFKGEKGKAMAKMTAEMQVNMMYAPLFKDLNLPADAEEQVRGIVSKNLEKQMQAGLKMISGEKVDAAQMAKDEVSYQQEMRSELAKVLSADEMAKYDQFQEEMPRHALEQQYDMQLSMTGSTMKPESRDLVKQTLVEEVLAIVPDIGKPGSSSQTKPSVAFDAQITAIDKARERLRTQLDEEQFAMAERFLNQQLTQTQVTRDMVNNMMGGEKKPEVKKP